MSGYIIATLLRVVSKSFGVLQLGCPLGTVCMQDVKEDPDLMTDDDDDDEMEDLDALAKGMDRGSTAPLPKAASAADTTTNRGTFCCNRHECLHLMSASDLTLSTELCICLYCDIHGPETVHGPSVVCVLLRWLWLLVCFRDSMRVVHDTFQKLACIICH